MMLRLLVLLALPLTAQGETANAPATERQPYTCDNRSRIDLSFTKDADGQSQATLHFSDESISLPQVPTPNGELYRAGEIRLHLRDNLAIFEDGKGNLRRCRKGPEQPAAPKPVAAASSFIDIAGHVSYRARIALPPDAVLIVRVQDTARAGAPARTLAEQRILLSGQQVPIAFQTTIDRDLIGKRSRVTVAARIEQAGRLLFISDKRHPALLNGQPRPVNIELKQVSNDHPR